ncbi:thiamine phosphate synthase [Hymenobacter sp. RP-2-7]|uniref:Thiamine phosphate synthase n=1 Tax=Hymenobacter polaris TaxID=2682546 RepID=A0A7Y0ABS8_9BACT|nr:thiamine phosphate synthase [Hymenobacter polaris]NML64447.1 thiamine phosphate synthase [Hymenobacter polaris]
MSQQAPPFQLLAITPPAQAAELPLLPPLFAAGLPRLHVRKPGWAAPELAAYVQAVPECYRCRLVLHSHYQLAPALGLGGIHLTEAARRDPATPQVLRRAKGLSVSASLHSLAELRQHRRRYTYVFLSPVFDSISKTDYASRYDLTELPAVLRGLAARPSYRPRVLALGGVAAGNLPLVQQAGFAGAAVLGALWQAPDPLGVWHALQAAAAGG